MKKKEINVILGERIRQERLRRKMTRERLAETVNVSSRFMADVESGAVGVSLSTLKSICQVLGISADYLLAITPEQEQSPERVCLNNRLAKLDDAFIPSMTTIIDEIIKMQMESQLNE